MIVTSVTPWNKQKSKVFLDGDFAFALYGGELRRYGIREGGELSEDAYESILEDVLYGRAKERSLYLLKASDKTEYEIQRKLEADGYPKKAIEFAVGFLKEYHFVDDENYARRYVEIYGSRRSKRRIAADLRHKGIGDELLRKILEEAPADEEEAVRALVRKKLKGDGEPDGEQKKKLFLHLARKGFSYDVIRRVLGEDFYTY